MTRKNWTRVREKSTLSKASEESLPDTWACQDQVERLKYTNQVAIKMEGVLRDRHWGVKRNFGTVTAIDVIITPISARNIPDNVQRAGLLRLYRTYTGIAWGEHPESRIVHTADDKYDFYGHNCGLQCRYLKYVPWFAHTFWELCASWTPSDDCGQCSEMSGISNAATTKYGIDLHLCHAGSQEGNIPDENIHVFNPSVRTSG